MTAHATPVPPDDYSGALTVALSHQDERLPHLGVVGDTYTILIAGGDIPPGGGPPPHRHDVEEMITVLDGQVEVTLRDRKDSTDTPSGLVSMCAPAGQEELFTLVGQRVAPEYRTELLPPRGANPEARQ